MLISCERSLKSKRATSEDEKDNATHITTTITILIIIYLINIAKLLLYCCRI